MLNDLDDFYFNKEEPTRGALLALRKYILEYNPALSESWTHRMPMFRFNGKLFCYLWVDKKTHHPYLGIYKGIEVDHPKLELGNRNKMKIISFDPFKDLPFDIVDEIFKLAIPLYDH